MTGVDSQAASLGGAFGVQTDRASQIVSVYFDTLTTGQGADSTGATGLTTTALQNGGATFTNAAFSGGAGGLYPYLTTFFPGGVQALTGAAPAGAQTALYVGGAQLGAGDVSAGANGYLYLAVPAGTLAASGNKVGASVIVSSSPGMSALSYADNLAVTNGVLALPALISGTVSETTSEVLFIRPLTLISPQPSARPNSPP